MSRSTPRLDVSNHVLHRVKANDKIAGLVSLERDNDETGNFLQENLALPQQQMWPTLKRG